MAKRYVDTNLHKKDWYRKLPLRMREAWRILCAECDLIGVWDINLDYLNFIINDPHNPITLDELRTSFAIRVIDDEKLFITGFVAFQYGDEEGKISPKNKLVPKLTRMLVARNLPLPAMTSETSPMLDASPIDPPVMGLKTKTKTKTLRGECEGRDAKEFSDALAKYKEHTGIGISGKGAKARFQEQVKTPQDLQDLFTAIANYKTHLEIETWKRPRQSFASFLGSNDENGSHWKEFVTWSPPPSKQIRMVTGGFADEF